MQGWKRLREWLPSALWALLISGASTDAFSSEHTSLVVIPILRWLFPHADPEVIAHIHFLIRKTAHFTEYFIFSLLLWRGVRGENRGWQLRWALWAFFIAAGYSAMDEFHQSFVPSRTASPWDALIDTTGAGTAQILIGCWFWLQSRLFWNASERAQP